MQDKLCIVYCLTYDQNNTTDVSKCFQPYHKLNDVGRKTERKKKLKININ